MVRHLIITIAAMLMLCGSAHATGLTLWGLTEQVSSVDSDNAITGRIGYDLSVGDNGGLEPFIGSVWHPQDSTPQVIVVGAVQHFPDLLDPNGLIPYIPELFTTLINEDVAIRPYAGAQCTINLVDEDAGFIGAIAGVAIKLTPEATSELIFEASYDNTFSDLNDVPDNRLKGYMGFRIPF